MPITTRAEAPRLTFGIFPGLAGTEEARRADARATFDPDRTDEAPARSQPDGRTSSVRGYALYLRGRSRRGTAPGASGITSAVAGPRHPHPLLDGRKRPIEHTWKLS